MIEEAVKKVREANQQVFNEMDQKTAEKKGVKFNPPEPEKSETSVTDSSLGNDDKNSSDSREDSPIDTVANILNRHNYLVKFVCEQSAEYELEPFEVYQKDPIPVKAKDKKKDKASRIDVSQFKKMKWKKDHKAIDWEDQSFIFFERSNKIKNPTLAAVTKCCHSLCYFKRSNKREDQNGPEDHWCPM